MKDLSYTSHVGKNLREADLSGTDLRRAIFDGADLEGADLSGCDLRGASLKRANLKKAALDRPQRSSDGQGKSGALESTGSTPGWSRYERN